MEWQGFQSYRWLVSVHRYGIIDSPSGTRPGQNYNVNDRHTHLTLSHFCLIIISAWFNSGALAISYFSILFWTIFNWIQFSQTIPLSHNLKAGDVCDFPIGKKNPPATRYPGGGGRPIRWPIIDLCIDRPILADQTNINRSIDRPIFSIWSVGLYLEASFIQTVVLSNIFKH